MSSSSLSVVDSVTSDKVLLRPEDLIRVYDGLILLRLDPLWTLFLAFLAAAISAMKNQYNHKIYH